MKKPVVDYREVRLRRVNEPQYAHLKYLLGWVGYFILFFLTENLIPVEKCYPVHCWLDDVIPFCEFFIIPYVFWYVLIVVTLVYINGQKITKTVTPVLGEKAAHNGNVVYSLDFQVTPHQLRHTYITNLIYASVDPKTVQYLAGHENSKITMDIYAKVKYNKPEQLSAVVNTAFGQPA